LVLLSKADLLANRDLHRTTSYIVEHVKQDLGLSVVVHPLSALSKYSAMLDQFFERELFPRFERARTLSDLELTLRLGPGCRSGSAVDAHQLSEPDFITSTLRMHT
jgi:hypothetical protein